MRLTELWAGVALTSGDPGFDTEITGLACHSREVVPGSLFAAVPGQLSDGHAYISDAAARGRRPSCASIRRRRTPAFRCTPFPTAGRR